jgi:hypothetical protein
MLIVNLPNDNDSQITNAHLGRWSYTVSGFGGETQNPGPGVVDVDLSVTRMDCLQCDAIPTTEFD